MRLVKGHWEVDFKRLLTNTGQGVLIIVPFITRRAATLLCPFLEQKQFACRLITRCDLEDFWSGVSDHRALRQLVDAGAQVKSLKGLHAKVYTFDDKNAVVTSANLTGGGLSNDHEWGILFDRDDCPEVFEEANALWNNLKNSVDATALSAIDQQLTSFRDKHPQPTIELQDLLPDLGETYTPNRLSDGLIRLRTITSTRSIKSLLDDATVDRRVANAQDFTRICTELDKSRFRSISLRSFLWLTGWCNTGRAYGRSSAKYLQPLAIAMFGYVPEGILRVGGQPVDLKMYRYGASVQRALESEIVAHHLDRLAD